MPKLARICAFVAIIGSSLPSSSIIANAQVDGAVQYPPASVGDDAQPPPPARLAPQSVAPRRIELGVSGSSQLPGNYQLRLRTGIGGFTLPSAVAPAAIAAPPATAAGN